MKTFATIVFLNRVVAQQMSCDEVKSVTMVSANTFCKLYHEQMAMYGLESRMDDLQKNIAFCRYFAKKCVAPKGAAATVLSVLSRNTPQSHRQGSPDWSGMRCVLHALNVCVMHNLSTDYPQLLSKMSMDYEIVEFLCAQPITGSNDETMIKEAAAEANAVKYGNDAQKLPLTCQLVAHLAKRHAKTLADLERRAAAVPLM